MKIRVSHILKTLAVLLFIGGICSLFIKQPIKPITHKQKELYSSTLYQYLDKSGKEKKAWVTSIRNNKDNTSDIVVKFFDEYGQTKEAFIPLIKVKFNEGDFVDILYNVNAPEQARILPDAETVYNWPLLGWCLSIGVVLYWLGMFRQKVSGGIE